MNPEPEVEVEEIIPKRRMSPEIGDEILLSDGPSGTTTPVDREDPINVDMNAEFNDLSLEYDYKSDPTLDGRSKRVIEEIPAPKPVRYTRRTSSILPNEVIELKDRPSPKKTAKAISPNAYIPSHPWWRLIIVRW